ncbi:MAG: hypothetical protein DRR04_06265 [Gammaproteobacteria bacterium]|nr:MAG: hypothetical protein DRQ97_02670 [Gammaproteobacteria bacterium]RLA60236.1 MAG: hypothetical protein DRR04_06265 [Gammaproteobacteria bacterium]
MKGSSLMVATLLLAVAPAALSDISYAQRIKVEAAGGMSMFASEGDVLTQISGDKSRTESTMTMKSKLMGAFSGGGNTGNIVRLDKALTWNLLPDKKQYSQMTFAAAKAQMEEARLAMQKSQAAGNSSGAALPVSAEGCEWTDGNLEVEHPGGTEKVADIKTKKHIIRMRQSCTDPDSGKTCDITWLMETWLAKKVPAEKEVRKFREAYAKALGLEGVMGQVEGPGRGLLAMFANNWDEVVDEFEKMKGYPLRTAMQMGIGGEQCTTASGQPIAMDKIWADASTAAYNSALDQAGYEAGNAMGQAAGKSLGDSVAGSIGGAAVGAAAGELIGGLTSMFKKKKTVEPEPQPQAVTAEGQITVFRITTEVIDWSEITIPSERFDEPVGWKKL